VCLAHAQELIETRMYRSLAGIVEGWSKNLALGSRRTAPEWAAPAVPWLVAAFLFVVWVVPPLTLLMSFTMPALAPLRGWSMAASGLGLLFWLLVHVWTRVPVLYALAYPLGAAATVALFIRSALRGSRVEWKGRAYAHGAEIAPTAPKRGLRR
jgi:hypothetical protein